MEWRTIPPQWDKHAPHAGQGAAPRICLDGRSLGLAHGTGVTTYAGVLAQSIHQAGYGTELLADTAGSRNEFSRVGRWLRALWPADRAAPLLPGLDGDLDAGEGSGLRLAPDVYRTAQVFLDLHHRPLTVRDRAPPALMHWTYPLPLRFRGVPNLYTVHDLIPLLQPSLTPIAGVRLRRILQAIVQRGAHVVTVSDASRRDILATLPLPPERVTNTYQAVHFPPDVLAPPEEVADTVRRLVGVDPGGFHLHAGTVEPRKNLARLIEAHRVSGTKAPLVLAGPDGWRAADELRQVAAAGTEGRAQVVRIPWTDRRTLVSLVRGARTLLMPSLAEGFGLPVVEAMALGTPVLTSGRGALAEVAGDAALLVDPLDIGDMARALAALDGDAALRTELSGRGPRRAAAFSVEAYARRLRALYDRVLANQPDL